MPSGLMFLNTKGIYIVSIIFYLFVSNFIFSQSESKKKKEKHLSSYYVQIVLCDGRKLNGNIRLEVPKKIIITHEVKGIEFTKEIKIKEIHAIHFQSWTPELMEKKKNGKVYRFYVSRYKIELKDSLELKVVQPLPKFLEKFSFWNQFGKVILYSYWIDLLKPDKTWYTGLSGPENGERTFCHKDVIKKIIFKRES